ncbi:hypothetical protein T12_7070 [Trichinella patagoniensis]|uniref:Uncharacterized protein n=1 Tax=Trichinella patagoniensis TaxID=990121 RepID=A0A0V0Z0W0_9BILA|nr:hypothetical protein T12_7070 [Trichinella patagoniensis]
MSLMCTRGLPQLQWCNSWYLYINCKKHKMMRYNDL